MAVSTREVKNKRSTAGELTGRSGMVYDVNIKYKSGKQTKTTFFQLLAMCRCHS